MPPEPDASMSIKAPILSLHLCVVIKPCEPCINLIYLFVTQKNWKLKRRKVKEETVVLILEKDIGLFPNNLRLCPCIWCLSVCVSVWRERERITKRKSSSAPLNRKMTGWGGTHFESTMSRANSSIDAGKEMQTWNKNQNHPVILQKVRIRTNTRATIAGSKWPKWTVIMAINQKWRIMLFWNIRRNPVINSIMQLLYKTYRKLYLYQCSQYGWMTRTINFQFGLVHWSIANNYGNCT